jgi:ribosomal protein S3AE
MVSKAKSSDMKIKKKRWIDMVSPLFNNQSIGQTTVYDLNGALGKSVKINLMNLLGDPRRQNTDILFKTEALKGETAVIANIVGYEMQLLSLRKLVRRGKTKIQDSFKCYTGDKKPVIVKVFIISRNMVTNQVATKIRALVKQITVNKVSKLSFESLMKEIIDSKIQKETKSLLHKIYPIKLVEFNTVKIVDSAKGKFEVPKELDESSFASNKKKATDKGDSEDDDTDSDETPKESNVKLKSSEPSKKEDESVDDTKDSTEE